MGLSAGVTCAMLKLLGGFQGLLGGDGDGACLVEEVVTSVGECFVMGSYYRIQKALIFSSSPRATFLK